MLKAINLRTEYLINPMGIDITAPRFFWLLSGTGKEQSAFQIVVENDKGELFWDSGRMESSSYTHIQYQGRRLSSRNQLFWRVKVWDDTKVESEWSETAVFEMGLLNSEDWKAQWVTGDYVVQKDTRYPADYFRKHFTIKSGVSKARLYITACGLYEALLNGQRAGEICFAPGCTDYRKRLQYQTYDVTNLLKDGENTLEVILGDGWYRGKIGGNGKTYVYGQETKLLCQLEIWHSDGTGSLISSDSSFEWCNDGALRQNDLKDGEEVDARKIPSYGRNAILTRFPLIPVSSNNVPVTEHEHFTPQLITTPNGESVLDFGQNIAGIIAFTVQGPAGHEITIRLGETLDSKGCFTQRNFNMMGKESALQQVKFFCSGKREQYKQKFAVSGFRYALVDNWPGDIDPNTFEAIAVYSAMSETGAFECSNPLVNQLVQNAKWSTKGNFLDVPTDCPTRERAGWTGDAQVYFNAGSYLMDTAAFFRKWMDDVTDSQTENGKLDCMIPYIGDFSAIKPLQCSVGWADAMILIPYRYWKMYGDKKFLNRYYDAMKQYAEYLIGRAKRSSFSGRFKRNPYKKYTCDTGHHFGEWLEPEEYENLLFGILFSRPEEATAYLSYVMQAMSEIATALGKEEDAGRYKEYADGAKKAYRYLFLEKIDSNTKRQAKLVRPLALGLLDEEEYKRIYKLFVNNVRERKHTIGTGFMSTPFVLPLLSENGNVEDAYKMLEQTQVPGWLYQVEHGATTIWEDWTGHDKQGEVSASYNHYSFGAVCEWLFAYAAGIRVDAENHFTIRPQPGGSLDYIKCHYDSIYGRVSCGWERKADYVVYSITIPSGAACTFIDPNGKSEQLTCGEHLLKKRV